MSALVLISGGVHQVEDDIMAILGIVETALAALADGDPVRADLEEIRTAARIAVTKTEALAARAA
jgi:hypothetical protein